MATKPGAPEFWSDPKEHIRKVAQVANQLQKGQGNSSFKVSLAANEATTTVLVSFARGDQIALFSPQDQATAAAIASGFIWTVVTDGRITIHHDSTISQRALGVCLFG